MPSRPISKVLTSFCLQVVAVIAVAIVPLPSHAQRPQAPAGLAPAGLLLPTQAALCTRQVRRHVLSGRCWTTNVMRCCRPSGRGCRVVAHHKRGVCRR